MPALHGFLMILAILAALASSGCEGSGAGVSPEALPACERACASEPPGISTLAMDKRGFWTFAAGVEAPTLKTASLDEALAEIDRLDAHVAQKLGLPRAGILYLKCAAEVDADRIASLLEHPGAERYVILALAGRSPQGVGHAPVKLWSAAQARADVERGVVEALTDPKAIQPCSESLATACPVLLAPVDGRSCADLVALADAAALKGRALGFVARP